MLLWRQLTYIGPSLQGQFVFTLQAVRTLILQPQPIVNNKTVHNINAVRSVYLQSLPQTVLPQTTHHLNTIRVVYLTRTIP